MKLSISTKLFIAVLASVLFVILSMGLATSWSFTRGFLGYLNEQALERMESVQPRMVSAWQREGSWDFCDTIQSAGFNLCGQTQGMNPNAATLKTRCPRT